MIYKNSLGFVFPSISEGFGLPGLEAMTAGTLTIASDIPVFREVYKDSVFYFDPNDAISIKECMKKIINLSPKERKSRISKGEEYTKRYSWEVMAKQTLEVYEKLVDSTIFRV